MNRYDDLDSPTRAKRLMIDERKAKYYAEKLKTSKTHQASVEAQTARRQGFLNLVSVKRITDSKYGRFIQLTGACPM